MKGRIDWPKTRRRVGTLVFDSPKGAWPLLVPGALAARHWTEFHNRGEKLRAAPDGRGFACDWKWTSDLNLCRFWPRAGGRLLRAALRQWPIRMGSPATANFSPIPRVSFIIGHRGAARLPHLLATLASLLNQEGCAFEIVVVEQAWEWELKERLPEGVRYFGTRPPAPETPYSRSWAFNVGAREARGEILVFHDNDLLAPAAYCRELSSLFDLGHEAASLQRLVFYLDGATSKLVFSAGVLPPSAIPEAVRQNCQGHSIAVRRDAYFRIGGHDEAFVGWGGEDNEFFDRVKTLRSHLFGYLPFVHLHHPPSPGREAAKTGIPLLDERMRTPRNVRIERLRTQFASEVSSK